MRRSSPPDNSDRSGRGWPISGSGRGCRKRSEGKHDAACDGPCRRAGRSLRQAPPPNSSTLASSSLGRHLKARSIPLTSPPCNFFLGSPYSDEWIQPRSSVYLGKSAWDRCRQRRPRRVVSELRYWLAPSSEGHRTNRPGPKRSREIRLACSLGEPQRLDFDAAEVYARVGGLQLWQSVEKGLFFAGLRAMRTDQRGRTAMQLSRPSLAWIA